MRRSDCCPCFVPIRQIDEDASPHPTSSALGTKYRQETAKRTVAPDYTVAQMTDGVCQSRLIKFMTDICEIVRMYPAQEKFESRSIPLLVEAEYLVNFVRPFRCPVAADVPPQRTALADLA